MFTSYNRAACALGIYPTWCLSWVSVFVCVFCVYALSEYWLKEIRHELWWWCEHIFCRYGFHVEWSIYDVWLQLSRRIYSTCFTNDVYCRVGGNIGYYSTVWRFSGIYCLSQHRDARIQCDFFVWYSRARCKYSVWCVCVVARRVLTLCHTRSRRDVGAHYHLNGYL